MVYVLTSSIDLLNPIIPQWSDYIRQRMEFVKHWNTLQTLTTYAFGTHKIAGPKSEAPSIGFGTKA